MTNNKKQIIKKKLVRCPYCKKILIVYGEIFFRHCGRINFLENNKLNEHEYEDDTTRTKKV